MSSIVNKIKEAVHPDRHSEAEGTHGPHSSRAANAADPRVDSDRDHSHTVGGRTGAGNTYSENSHYTTGSGNTHTSGPHNSDALNKADPRVDSDRDGSKTLGGNNTYGSTGTTGLGSHGTHAEGTHGPHNSRIANAADPRVDSDRDGSRTAGGNTYGSTTTGTTGFGSSGTHTAGPHRSDALNKADPRVDSDRDGSRTVGGNNTYGSTGTSGLGSHGTTGSTFGSSGTHAEGTHGPHNSRIANAADPRVDSDRDGSRTAGGNTYGSSTTHGEHNTLGRVGAGIGGTHGTGPAPNTAGPHKSDMLNKVDPRVDSDLDGSKTVGQNKTYSQSNSTGPRDPTDAAQVPPSVLRKHLGDPVIEHDHPDYDRERRHSRASHQENFSGV